jgi:hypothetical protein
MTARASRLHRYERERLDKDLRPRTAPRARRPGDKSAAKSADKKGPGASLLLLVLPVLCCGGPAVVAALAAASAATLGVVGGIVGSVLLAVAIGLIVRHRRRGACDAPAQKAWRP